MALDQWSDKVVVVHLGDDPQFTEDMDAVEAHRHKALDTDFVLDFSGVRFVNSSNIASLLRLRKQLVQSEGRMILCGTSDQVWRAFHATGLDKILEFSASVPNALATLQM